MTVPRIFISDECIAEGRITITGDTYHKLTRVLRTKPGERIMFFNGNGKEFETSVESISKKQCVCKILQISETGSEERINITLAPGILKKDKMEAVIEKSAELGVRRILPLTLKRNQVKLTGQAIKSRIERWTKIAAEACALSKRAVIPSIERPISIEELKEASRSQDVKIVFWEKASKNLKTVLSKMPVKKPLSVIIVIGPEGGLCADEIEALEKADFHILSFGKNILSAETAVFTALSIIIYETGGFR